MLGLRFDGDEDEVLLDLELWLALVFRWVFRFVCVIIKFLVNYKKVFRYTFVLYTVEISESFYFLLM